MMTVANNQTTMYLNKQKIGEIIRAQSSKLNKLVEVNVMDEHETVFICVLNGAVPFYMEMVNRLDIKGAVIQNFIKITSYKNNEQSEEIAIHLLDNLDLKDRRVVVFEDFIDTGRTLSHLLNQLKEKGCESIHLFSLLSKVDLRTLVEKYEKQVEMFHIGHFVEEHKGYLVGFGLDDNGRYRELDYIKEIKN